MDECVSRAESASSVFESGMLYMLSSTPEVGLEIGLAEIKCEQSESLICAFLDFWMLFISCWKLDATMCVWLLSICSSIVGI